MKYLLLLLFLASALGCYCNDGTYRTYELSTLSSIKLISKDISDPKDESTFNQDFYTLGPGRRLLIKSDQLDILASDIIVDSYFVMALEIYTDSNEWSEEDLQGLKLCSLTKNWMYMATWTKAHSFSKPEWSRPGGDFSESDCISVSGGFDSADITVPQPNKNKSEDKSAVEADPGSQSSEVASSFFRLQFNVTQWFLNQVKASHTNYGFVLISEKPIPIWGGLGQHAPSTKWSQPYTSKSILVASPFKKDL